MQIALILTKFLSVRLLVGTDDPETYTIVGSDESDPLNGKISNDSPIAQALLGKKKGEKVTINTPGGTFDVTINDVKTLN